MNVEKIREDFPILQKKVKGKPLVYLDSTATSLTPQQVVKAITDYYENYNANIHRGVYEMSEVATQKYEEAHQKVADFINASFEEIIFTHNTTQSINIVASMLSHHINEGDEIIVSEMEHHSNLVPWQQYAKEKNAVLKVMRVDDEGKLIVDESLFTDKTKIVAATHVSNVLGTINPIKKIGELAHKRKAYFIVDAAQSVPHMSVDVKDIDCDFMAFSLHKMCGPTGVGVLYGKRKLLDIHDPVIFGGDMIKEVSLEDATYNDLPWKFEAGTPNIAGGIGAGAAIDYLAEIGMENIREHEKELTAYALEKLSKLNNVTIYGPQDIEERGGVIAFNLKGIHPHDVSTILDEYGVAVRGGHHCAMPLMKRFETSGSCRASFYLYNKKEEIDTLIEGLKKAQEIFGD